MKRVLCLAVAVLMTALVFVGCGDGGDSGENVIIESLPYSVPYYKDATVEVLSVKLYQTEADNHGKVEYAPYVLVEVDESGIDALSEDDAYWAEQEVEIDYKCDLYRVNSDLIFEDMEQIASGTTSEGNAYYAFSLFDVHEDAAYYETFDGTDINLAICVWVSDSEKPKEKRERILNYYYYTEKDTEANPADEMDTKIQQSISDGMWREAEVYINNLRN